MDFTEYKTIDDKSVKSKEDEKNEKSPSENNDNNAKNEKQEKPEKKQNGEKQNGEKQNGGDTIKEAYTSNGVIDNLLTSLSNTFTLKNILFFIWFLAIYLIIFYLTKMFNKNENDVFKEKIALSRSIDILLFGLLIIFIIYSYYSLSEKDKKDLITYLLKWTMDFYNKPTTFFDLSLFILIFYCFIYLCGVPMTKETRPIFISILEQKLWLVLISVIIVDFFKYILGISIIDVVFGKNGELITKWNNLKNTDVKTADVKTASTPTPTPKPAKNEVFNISNNLYTYEDAQTVCQAFNARLATVNELNDAYKDGAEWCVNSWSADKYVLFPTQQSTFDKLQKIKGAENSCGRTGVNGGKVENEKLRFGVNCYGVKPAPTDQDKIRMNNANNVVRPKTKSEMITDAKVNFWKENRDKYVILNPFNSTKWNE